MTALLSVFERRTIPPGGVVSRPAVHTGIVDRYRFENGLVALRWRGDVPFFSRTTSIDCDDASPSPVLSDEDVLHPLLPCLFVHPPVTPNQLLLQDTVVRGQYYMTETIGHIFMREWL